jgi:hypothetical protein
MGRATSSTAWTRSSFSRPSGRSSSLVCPWRMGAGGSAGGRGVVQALTGVLESREALW